MTTEKAEDYLIRNCVSLWYSMQACGREYVLECLVGAVLIFRWAGTVAVVVTGLLCSAAIIAKSMLHRNPLPGEESASRQQTAWAVEVKSNHQKSGHWVEKLQGVAAA